MKTTDISFKERQLLEEIFLNKIKSSKKEEDIPEIIEHEIIPLSFGQKRLWFMEQLGTSNTAYNSADALRLRGSLNIQVLKKSIEIVIQRHESLRTTFKSIDGEPYQYINHFRQVPINLEDISNEDEASKEFVLKGICSENLKHPFDLEKGPLFKITIVRLSSLEHILLITIHHISTDGWSMRNLFTEIFSSYNALVSSSEIALPELKYQYANYSMWQHNRLSSGQLNNQLNYWKNKLKSISELNFPANNLRKKNNHNNGEQQSLDLPMSLVSKLQDLSSSNNVTLFMTMLSAFKVLLYKYTNQEDITIGTSVAGRSRKEFENLIGFFVNLLALRTDISGNPTFNELLTRVKDTCLEGFSNQDYPFEKIVEELNPERDPSKLPLFQILFQVQQKPEKGLEVHGLQVFRYILDTNKSKFDMMVNIVQNVRKYRIDIEYNSSLFSKDTIKRFLRNYVQILNEICMNSEKKISQLNTLSNNEYGFLINEINQTNINLGLLSLHGLFENKAKQNPDAIGIIYRNKNYSYKYINEKSNQLAHYLIGKGIKSGSNIGISMNKSLDMVIGFLGILKAGCAYVPIDPNYPFERIKYMVSDARVSHILTHENISQTLPLENNIEYIHFDQLKYRIDKKSIENPNIDTNGNNLAYIMYTSGSTGKPKGIMNIHKGVANNILDLNTRYNVSDKDVILNISSMSFDMCVYETLGILIAGGATVIPNKDSERNPECWNDLVINFGVTIWNSAPALLDIYTSYLEEEFSEILPIRLILLGGDWIPTNLPKRFGKFADKNIEVIALGGATEVSIHSLLFSVNMNDVYQESIPYGKPMHNQKAYILDEYLNPCPIGVKGDLYIGGIGLARGYINNPRFTAERFLPNPFLDNERIYMTGDIGEYLPDGNVKLLGRKDFQVKINGLRIELGEIESSIKKFKEVKSCVVIAKKINSRNILVAYLTINENYHELDIKQSYIKSHLKNELPLFMIPAHIVVVDKIPLSPNGKVDRKQLINMDINYKEDHNIIQPRSKEEKYICNIWKSILGLSNIGVDQNFFEIGGNSFKAIKVLRELRILELIDIFKNPTIGSLAEVYIHRADEKKIKTQANLLVNLKRNETANYSVVCIPYGGGSEVVYSPLAETLDNSYNLYSVSLPGHSLINRDFNFMSVEEIARKCVEEIMMNINNEVILYGQCAGSPLTIEIARLLEKKNIKIKAVYLGAYFPNKNSLQSLEKDLQMSDTDMINFLTELGGFEEVLDEAELSYLVKSVKHDLSSTANYLAHRYRKPSQKLRTPVYSLIGDKDRTTYNFNERYKDWSFFAEEVNLVVLKGAGHYFVKHQADQVAKIIIDHTKNSNYKGENLK